MPEESVLTNRSTDLVTFTVLVDGAEISGSYEILSIMMSKEINKITQAKLILADGSVSEKDFSVSNSEDFVPGKEIELKVGYHSEEEQIFKGIIIKHGIKIKSGKRSILEIECRDKAIKLTGARHSAYYSQIKDSDLMIDLIEKYSLEADVDATNLLHPEIVQYNCTDWDFLINRAEVNGLIAVNDSGTIKISAPDLSQESVLTLTYGTSIIEFEAEMDARNQLSTVTSHSWDFATQELVEEEASAPSFDNTGNIPVEDLSEVINSEGHKMYHGGELETEELKAWADARLLKGYLAKIRGRVRIDGYSGIQPDNIVTLEGVGDRFNGDAYVSGVVHQIFKGTWITDIQLGLSPQWFSKSDDIMDTPAGGLLPAIQGLHLGKVVQIGGDEQEGDHRILVKIPFVEEDGGTDAMGVWARVSNVFAGENRGMVFRPELDDEVLLGFINGDPRDPVILGSLHSNINTAPIEASDDNFEKGIYTRGEMQISFDDDKKNLLIKTESGNSIMLSEENGEIAIDDENGNSVKLNSDGISLESVKDIILKASGDVKIEGVNVEAEANANLTLKGSAAAELNSSGNTTVAGSMVMIN
jgi:Rhs element Vgr protein